MNTKTKTKKMVTLSLLCAIVAVLSALGSFIRFGPFPITLVLCPIIIGAAMYGPGAGALLGTVFGVVTLISGLLGWDGGAVLLMLAANPVALVLVCVLKGTFAGLVAGLVYRLIAKNGHDKTAVVAAGIVCPVTNTGIFIAALLLFFRSMLNEWAGGTNVLNYILLTLTGINFLIELAVNMVLATAVTSILKYAGNRKRE